MSAYIKAVETFATLDLTTLKSDKKKAAYIEQIVYPLGMTLNGFIQSLRDAIVKLDMTHGEYAQHTFVVAQERALLVCALFNARRCYHARRFVLARAKGIEMAS